MPFKDSDRFLNDIVNAIGMIEQFTAGMDFVKFRADPKTVASVERMLLVVSEAAIRLGADAENRIPSQSWREIRGIGNWLRHQYDRIDLAAIWKTVTDDLPRLRQP